MRIARSCCSPRESNSGTYVYFLENVVRQGVKSDLMFSPDTLLMPSSEGISNGRAPRIPNTIGYDGLGSVTDGIRRCWRWPRTPQALPSCRRWTP